MCVSCGSVGRIHNSFRAAASIGVGVVLFVRVIWTWWTLRLGSFLAKHKKATDRSFGPHIFCSQTPSRLSPRRTLKHIALYMYTLVLYYINWCTKSKTNERRGRAMGNLNMEMRSFKCRCAPSSSLILIMTHNMYTYMQHILLDLPQHGNVYSQSAPRRNILILII